ncbi:SDR family oxidoreductase [Nakamurella aerolata]|uniref:SDR family oxidoreductase n=1 Tax=Nakamurella aerolata TaxID=1656892 RepID=A0A849AC92_9ACTN|nr:SDR family oxidoreductase [Nakamurella aerolata]NNG37216.1 SDR family oxidoreductase [Nakamurella aerolata]
MAKIVIIGGHGKVALLAEPLLVDAGHQVTALIRNVDQADVVAGTGAMPVVADVENLDTDAIAELLQDTDVVIWSAGAGGGDPERTYAVDRDAAIRAMDAAKQAGADRFVMVSYFGAGPEHGVPEGDSFYPYAQAKTEADEYLRQTDLRWTILRPSRLTLDPPTGKIDVTASDPQSVSRGDVAAVVATTVDLDATVGRTIEFNSGDVSVYQALAGLAERTDS